MAATGVTFAPGSDGRGQSGSGGAMPVQEAIRLLSFRLPTTVGPGAPTSPGLLAGGAPGAMAGGAGGGMASLGPGIEAWLRALFTGGGLPGSAPTASGGGPSAPGLPPTPSGGGMGWAPAPTFTYGGGPEGPGAPMVPPQQNTPIPNPPAPPYYPGPAANPVDRSGASGSGNWSSPGPWALGPPGGPR